MKNNLDFEARDTFYQFDERRLARVTPNMGLDNWWFNVIDRTVEFWMLLDPSLPTLTSGLDDCLYLDERGRFALKRHPDFDEAASRDNWTMFFVYRFLRLTGEGIPMKGSFHFLVKNSPRHRGMQLWKRALAGHSDAAWWYYFWNIPGARIRNFVWKTLKWIGGFGPELTREEFISDPPFVDLYQEGIRKIMLNLVPAFALYKKAWQLFVMPVDPRRDRLRRILLRRVSKRNGLLRTLLGEFWTDGQIDALTPISGWPASTELSEYTDRDHRWIPSDMIRVNELERPLIKKIRDYER